MRNLEKGVLPQNPRQPVAESGVEPRWAGAASELHTYTACSLGQITWDLHSPPQSTSLPLEGWLDAWLSCHLSCHRRWSMLWAGWTSISNPWLIENPVSSPDHQELCSSFPSYGELGAIFLPPGNPLLYFNWSPVDLQCCVNYCCIAKWFSYSYICILFLYSFWLWFIIEYCI